MGLFRVAGFGGGEIEIKGKKYRVRKAITFGQRAELEAMIVAARPDPLLHVYKHAEGMSPNVFKSSVEVALRLINEASTVTEVDYYRWLDTFEGTCAYLWVALRDDYEEFRELDAVKAALVEEEETRLALIALMAQRATGELDLKNSSGPTAEEAAETTETPTTGPSVLPGCASTDSSSPSKDGRSRKSTTRRSTSGTRSTARSARKTATP